MTRTVPPLSTDHVLALATLARAGSIHQAAVLLHLSDEGLRGRLLALEQRLGVELYAKERGRRGPVSLTPAGRTFVGKAARFLEQASELALIFDPGSARRDIHVLSSHYLTGYLLIQIVREFQARHPQATIRLSTRDESQVLSALLGDPSAAIGVCAPPEFPRRLQYARWFSMEWSFVAPLNHALASRSFVNLADIAEEPLIVFEPASTGRQHVLEAFHAVHVEPRIAMEATTTQLIVAMVAAGLGVSILPLLPSGKVTRGQDVVAIPIRQSVRPIESGVFLRSDFEADPLARELVSFILSTRP